MQLTTPRLNWFLRYCACVVVLVAACLACSADDRGGKQTANIASPVNIQTSFRNSLDEITKHWKIAIIAEGSPVIGPTDLKDVRIQEIDNVEQAIERVAIAYDYLVENDHPVYVLTKRFTNPDDIPDTTLEEARYSLGAISRLLSRFNPSYAKPGRDGDPRFVGMKQALSSAQITALATTGVPVSSLNESQRAEASRFALSLYMQATADSVTYASNLLSAMSSLDLKFLWKRLDSQDEFGFQVTLGDPLKLTFRPLSHPDSVSAQGDGSIVHLNNQSNGLASELDDPSKPTDELERVEAAAALQPADTLSSVAQRLVKSDSNSPGISVDSQYRAKSVTVSGEANASASRLASGLAVVYGLVVRHRLDGAMVITHCDEPEAEDIRQAAGAVMAFVPRNLQRLLDYKALSLTPAPPGDEARERNSKIAALLITAKRIVRAGAEPAARNAPTHTAPLSVLTVQERKALTFSESVAGFSAALRLATRPVPAYIFDFDHIVLTGGIKNVNSRRVLELFLSYTDTTTGHFFKGSGGWGVFEPL